VEYHRQTKEWPTAANAEDFVKLIREWIQVTSPTLLEHELLQEDALTQLAATATAEVAPVCAVLGGMLGNEVIKAISGKGEPANNTVLFDGDTW
jgi:ubiquitin-like 1-activating enzyme E1 A